MNKTDLIKAVAANSGLTLRDAACAVDTFIHNIESTLSSGDSVTIAGFGTFSVKDRAARTGRNPRTGEAVEIAATKVPAFKPGRQLKEAIAG